MFAVFLRILVFSIIGGILAIIGNSVGRYFGKKKLTLFSLRPRYTSMVFTIITGMFIATFTVLILALLSNDVRVALIGIDKLKKEKLKLLKEINYLNTIKTKGDIIYPVNSKILVGLISKKTPPKKVKLYLHDLISRANSIIKSKYIAQAKQKHIEVKNNLDNLIVFNKDEFNKILKDLSNKEVDKIVILSNSNNVFLFDKVVVNFQVKNNKVIYKKGDIIAYSYIKKEITNENEALSLLFRLIQKVKFNILSKGFIADPYTKEVGGNIPMYDVLMKSQMIVKKYKKDFLIEAIAKEDITLVPPVKVDLKLVK